MKLRERLRLPRPVYGALVWLLFTLVGLAFSVGVAGVAAAAKDDFSLADITDGGQFAVLTTSMLVATYYVILKPADDRLPGLEWFGIVLLLLIGFAAAVMVLSSVEASHFNQKAVEALADAGTTDEASVVNPSIFRWPSIGLFALSAFVALIAVGLDIRRTQTDPAETLRHEREDLRDAFRELP